MKIRKIEAGLYETLDGRFRVENMYAPAAGNRGLTGASPKYWKIQAMDGTKPFRVILANKKNDFWNWKQTDTLKKAREALSALYSRETNEPLTQTIGFTKAQLEALNTLLYQQTSIPDEIAIEILQLISNAQNELTCRRNGWDFEPFDIDLERSLMLTAEAYTLYRAGKLVPSKLF